MVKSTTSIRSMPDYTVLSDPTVGNSTMEPAGVASSDRTE